MANKGRSLLGRLVSGRLVDWLVDWLVGLLMRWYVVWLLYEAMFTNNNGQIRRDWVASGRGTPVSFLRQGEKRKLGTLQREDDVSSVKFLSLQQPTLV